MPALHFDCLAFCSAWKTHTYIRTCMCEWLVHSLVFVCGGRLTVTGRWWCASGVPPAWWCNVWTPMDRGGVHGVTLMQGRHTHRWNTRGESVWTHSSLNSVPCTPECWTMWNSDGIKVAWSPCTRHEWTCVYMYTANVYCTHTQLQFCVGALHTPPAGKEDPPFGCLTPSVC